MRKTILSSCLILTFIYGAGQPADSLNRRSKELLAGGDVRRALPLIRQAATEGNSEAQYNYGVCYQQGIELKQNDSLALYWFRLSAGQGWKDAEFKLALAYGKGAGVPRNDSLAFYWSLRCARQKDPDCMFDIASAYLDGRGVSRSRDSMLVWAIRLASLENPADLSASGRITSARMNLAVMYRDGKMVRRDLVKSYLWFLIYNESKRDFSISLQEQAVVSIQQIDKILSNDQKKRAVAEAEKILGRELINLDHLYQPDY